MVSADNATYAYNAQGLRVSKSVGNTTTSFLLVGGDVWVDTTAAYLRGIELISNGTQLYLYNVRGDVIQLLGFDGEVDKTYDYDAYGNELQRNSNDSNPFRYCGEYYDTETGFIYLRARYYDPMVGRFTSVDPAKDGLNWYAYCEGNPVKYVDPSGECAESTCYFYETVIYSFSLGFDDRATKNAFDVYKYPQGGGDPSNQFRYALKDPTYTCGGAPAEYWKFVKYDIERIAKYLENIASRSQEKMNEFEQRTVEQIQKIVNWPGEKIEELGKWLNEEAEKFGNPLEENTPHGFDRYFGGGGGTGSLAFEDRVDDIKEFQSITLW